MSVRLPAVPDATLQAAAADLHRLLGTTTLSLPDLR